MRWFRQEHEVQINKLKAAVIKNAYENLNISTKVFRLQEEIIYVNRIPFWPFLRPT